MYKLFFTSFFFTLLFFQTYSQIEQVSGIVYSTNGFAIRGAKVKSGIDKKTVLTDSAGRFTIELHLPDNLFINYDGFESKKVPVTADFGSLLSIQLLPQTGGMQQSDASVANSQGLQNSIDARSATNNSFVYGSSGFSRGVMLPSFTYKENTKGSQYLLTDWANGRVEKSDNTIANNTSFVYNYDKMNGSLIMTNDMKTAVTIDNSAISRFTLLPKSGTDSLTFVMQPLVDKNAFVQLLADGNKYKLYKKIKTTFKKSDYHNSGLTSSGNDYDEYVDQTTYYVLQTKDNSIKEIALKSKAIKSDLPSESAKIDSFFNQNKISKPDEKSLVQLINLLNQ